MSLALHCETLQNFTDSTTSWSFLTDNRDPFESLDTAGGMLFASFGDIDRYVSLGRVVTGCRYRTTKIASPHCASSHSHMHQ